MLFEDVEHRFLPADGIAFRRNLAVRAVIRELNPGCAIGNLQVINKPVAHLARALAHHLGKHGIVGVLADAKHVFVKKLWRVLRFFHDLALIASARCSKAAVIECGNAASGRPLFDENDI